MRHLTSLAFASLALFACTAGYLPSGLPPGSDGGLDTGSTSSGGVGLSVASTISPSKISDIAPAAGSFFAEVDLTLHNTGSSSPLSANFVLFALATDKSLVLNTSPTSGAVSPECSPMTSVAEGGQFECKVAFEVPTGQTPTTLLYDDKQGHKASAPVPGIPPSSACDKWIAAAEGSAACQQCLAQAAKTGQCNLLSGTKQSACGGQDTSKCNAVFGTDFCMCYQAAVTSSCWAAFESYAACAASACESC